jgi:YVTN family beta-propeller protein
MKVARSIRSHVGAKLFSLAAALTLPLLIATTPAGGETVCIYIINAAGDSVHVIDPATDKAVQQIMTNLAGARIAIINCTDF